MAITAPTDITGCVLWLDAQDDTSFTYGSGVEVSQWDDKSGGGRHVVQATGSKQPSRNLTLNNHDVVNFVKANVDYMAWAGSNAITGTAMSVVIYCYMDGTPAQDDRVVTVNPTGAFDYAGPGGGIAANVDASKFPSAYRQGLKSVAPSIFQDQWVTVTSIYDGTNHTMYTGTTGYTPVSSTGNFDVDRINISGDETGIKGANVRIAEVIIYNVALSSTQRTDVWDYIDARWAVIPEAPEAPTITAQGGGYQRAGVEWTVPADGGSAITDYDIDWATAAAPTTWLGPVATGSTLPYGSVTGLTNATVYVFRVRAVNAIGDGAWSSTSGSATPSDVRGFFLLESGDKFLLEDGTSKFLLEAGSGVSSTPLLVDDAAHAHSAANVALTQHQVLAVAAATHSHTAANVALTQHQVLAVAAATHAHSAAAVALVQHQVLAVNGATHAHTAAAVALTQHQVLAVAAATHGHTAATVALTQHYQLAVADATHGHTAANVGLGVTLTIADATHAHTAGAVALYQHQVLAVAAATHSHTAATVALTQHQVLTVNNAGHAHTAAAVVLAQHQVLAVAAATHGHSAEAVVVDAHGPGAVTLVVADAAHAHTAQATILVQHQVLTVAGATHGHSAANVTLTQHQVLVVASATHGHTAGNVTLSIGVATLVVADTGHAHTAAAVALYQHQVLVVAGTTHSHTAAAVVLVQHQVLAVDGAVHGHTVSVVMFIAPIIGGHGTGVIVWRDGGTGTVTARDAVSATIGWRDNATGTTAHRDTVLATVGAQGTGTGEVTQP